ncbi:MAG: hypothetical protein SGPRY_005752 [Prymnesium sp.]
MLKAALHAIERVHAQPWLDEHSSPERIFEPFDPSRDSPDPTAKRASSFISVTDRTQHWTELQTTPLESDAPQSEPRVNDMSAFYRMYKTCRRLGSGGFGVVFMAINRQTGDKVAVKKLNSRDMRLGDIHREAEVLRALVHPNIVQVIDIYWNDEKFNFFLVEELQLGKELFQWVAARSPGPKKGQLGSSRHAGRVVSQLLCGLRHLHERGVIHRDIKPSNLLMSDDSDDAWLRISDFGLCALLKQDETARATALPTDVESEWTSDSARHGVDPLLTSSRRAQTPVRKEMLGTPEFMAPEVVMCAKPGSAGYSFPCDVWSAGCVVFALLTGHEHGPFAVAPGGARNLCLVFDAVLTCKAQFEEIPDDMARDLVWHMLALKPDLRYTAEDAQTHPWLLESEGSPVPKRPTCLPKLKKLHSDLQCEIGSPPKVKQAIHSHSARTAPQPRKKSAVSHFEPYEIPKDDLELHYAIRLALRAVSRGANHSTAAESAVRRLPLGERSYARYSSGSVPVTPPLVRTKSRFCSVLTEDKTPPMWLRKTSDRSTSPQIRSELMSLFGPYQQKIRLRNSAFLNKLPQRPCAEVRTPEPPSPANNLHIRLPNHVRARRRAAITSHTQLISRMCDAVHDDKSD